jgi:hypothetical protein
VQISVEFAILALIITPTFVNFVAFIFFLILLTGHIFWLCERKDNP